MVVFANMNSTILETQAPDLIHGYWEQRFQPFGIQNSLGSESV